MYRFAVVDDEEKDRERIIKLLADYFQGKREYVIDEFSNGEGLLSSFQRYDIVFLDVEMPGMNGIVVAEQFRMVDQDTPIILCANLQQYAVDGYRVNARGYLLKPISSVLFRLFMDKCLQEKRGRDALGILIKTELGMTNLSTRDIIYVQVQSHLLSFIYKKGTEVFKVTSRGSLADYENKLEPCGFVRCNIYSLVNMRYIFSVKNGKIEMEIGGITLPVGRTYKKMFEERFEWFLSHMRSDQ